MSRVGYFDFDKSSGKGSFTFIVPQSGASILGALERVVSDPLFRGRIRSTVRRGVSANLGHTHLLVAAPGGENLNADDLYVGIEVHPLFSEINFHSHMLCAFCYEVAIEVQSLRLSDDPYSHVTR